MIVNPSAPTNVVDTPLEKGRKGMSKFLISNFQLRSLVIANIAVIVNIAVIARSEANVAISGWVILFTGWRRRYAPRHDRMIHEIACPP